jgi:hypothetical protein
MYIAYALWCLLLVNRVGENWPLYDILNQFKKGQSHMAVVLKEKIRTAASDTDGMNKWYIHKLFTFKIYTIKKLGYASQIPMEFEYMTCQNSFFT